MRAFVPEYEVKVPKTLEEALAELRDDASLRPLAGGTDLMVLLEAGKLEPKRYLSLWRLKALKGIKVEKESVTLGALTTYSDVRRHEIVSSEFPLLVEAARLTGSIAIQNRGTLGGNIANASPAADSPPALLAYDAKLRLDSAGGFRWVPYHEFHRSYKVMNMESTELITAISLPRTTKGLHQYYRKVGTRGAQAISKVCLAAVARKNKGLLRDVRLALGSVAPVPLRLFSTEKTLVGRKPTPAVVREAREALAREIAPIDDIRSTREYRRRVAENLLAEFLEGLA